MLIKQVNIATFTDAWLQDFKSLEYIVWELLCFGGVRWYK